MILHSGVIIATMKEPSNFMAWNKIEILIFCPVPKLKVYLLPYQKFPIKLGKRV
jgi:hypothetical protein